MHQLGMQKERICMCAAQSAATWQKQDVNSTLCMQTTEGVYGFVAQLNEGRASKKRATEFCVSTVCQPFDGGKFNFRKAAMKEVLFQFNAGAVQRTRFVSGAACGPSPNLVLINVSPIEYGHVLLVPRVNDCIPQVVDQTSMLFALQCAHEVSNPFFRLGYNSLGAFGTINHLHFQGYFLEQPYPAEVAPTDPIARLPGKVCAASCCHVTLPLVCVLQSDATACVHYVSMRAGWV